MNNNGVCTIYEELLDRGVRDYPQLKETGKFLVTLNFRGWGKNNCLLCHFMTDDGRKFHLYAWRIQGGGRYECYCPRDSWPNFATVQDGTRWIVETKMTRNGNVFWATAEQRE